MTDREQIKALAAQSPKDETGCVVCNDQIKGKNRVRHFDTDHAPFMDAMTEDDRSRLSQTIKERQIAHLQS